MTLRRTVRIGCAGVLVLTAIALAHGSDRDASVSDLAVRRDGERFLVSYRVEGAFSPDLVERIGSGLEIAFVHRVEILVKRFLPLLPSRLEGRTTVEATVRYDSLTRQYYLVRRLTREMAGDDAPGAVEETRTATSSLSETEAWMTSIVDVPLPPPSKSESDRKARIRVRSTLGRRYRLLLFPGNETVDAEKELTP